MISRTLAAALLWLLVAAWSPAKPNVLLIISDDQAWADYGFMGHPHVRTPRIDRLAAESLCFPHGYVPSSLCCPSLATILTGQYPFQHGITGNEPPRPDPPAGNPYRTSDRFRADLARLNGFMERAPSLARILRDSGYRTLQTGKWWMGPPSTGGFTHGMTHGDPSRGGRHGDEGLRIGREGLQPIFEFVEQSADEPFFIWYAPFLPHTPHNPTERLVRAYRKTAPTEHVAKYWAMCTRFDETCGQLLDYLEGRGVLDDTVVVYVTDNGWIQEPDDSRYAERSKQSPYDGGIRTPILLRWPGKVPRGRVDTPVSSIDIAPTVLRLCGLDPVPEMPGIDLLDPRAVAGRPAVFGDCHLHNAVDIADPAANWTYRWVLSGGWKLIVPNRMNVTSERAAKGARGDGEVELYHVAEDPFERNDLAGSPARAGRLAGLRAQLDRWWTP